MKKKLLLMAACLGAMFAFTACGSKDDGNTLTVLNYGKYIESSVLDLSLIHISEPTRPY